MGIVQFRPEELAEQLGAPTAVPSPIGDPVSRIQSKSIVSASSPSTRTGLWTCSPGRWRRQVKQAELSHFLEGECTFTPDDGVPVEIKAGDVLYFPQNSTGVWDIRTPTRKIFIVFDEAIAGSRI